LKKLENWNQNEHFLTDQIATYFRDFGSFKVILKRRSFSIKIEISVYGIIIPCFIRIATAITK